MLLRDKFEEGRLEWIISCIVVELHWRKGRQDGNERRNTTEVAEGKAEATWMRDMDSEERAPV